MTEAELTDRLRATQADLEHLTKRFNDLERRTSMISPSFLKRAFAVYGHSIVAGLIIMVPLWLLFFGLFLVAGVAGMFAGK